MFLIAPVLQHELKNHGIHVVNALTQVPDKDPTHLKIQKSSRQRSGCHSIDDTTATTPLEPGLHNSANEGKKQQYRTEQQVSKSSVYAKYKPPNEGIPHHSPVGRRRKLPTHTHHRPTNLPPSKTDDPLLPSLLPIPPPRDRTPLIPPQKQKKPRQRSRRGEETLRNYPREGSHHRIHKGPCHPP